MSKTRILQAAKRPFALIIAVAMALALFPVTALAADYDGHWAQEYIDIARDRGWMNGYTDGTFRPNASITRAEFAVMLWRTLGEPAPAGACPFADVADDAWYADAVTALYEAGIISGVGNNLFAPNITLTREMGFVMLARAFKLTPTNPEAYAGFSDADTVSAWARDAVSALMELGYISGVGGNQSAPQKALTRGEMATLLINVFDGEHGTGTPEKPVEPAAEDKTAPSISLTHSPTGSTTGKVTVTVTATDDVGVAFIGWRSSASSATYTSTSGFSNVTNAKSFEVSTNGWYAVCATDAAGNFSYKLIEITNITASSGGGNTGTGTGTTSVAVTGVTISGTAMVGQTLTAAPAPANATSVTYQWYASDTNDNTSGVAIGGMTAKTLVLAAAQEGKYVYVIAKGASSSTATSAQTAIVAPAPIAVTFNSAVADGLAGNASTTKITLKFSQAITGLDAAGITIANGTGSVTKGALTPTATPGEYELAVTTTVSGNITVSVAKGGYTFTGNNKTVAVVLYVPPVSVAFSNADGDGVIGAKTTEKVTLTFGQDITGLLASNITITDTDGTGAAVNGLTSKGSGVYELALNGITASGNITVTVGIVGYDITPNSQSVAVVYYLAPVVKVVRASSMTTTLTITVDGLPVPSGKIYVWATDGTDDYWCDLTISSSGIVDMTAFALEVLVGQRCIIVTSDASSANAAHVAAGTGGANWNNDAYTAPVGEGVYTAVIE